MNVCTLHVQREKECENEWAKETIHKQNKRKYTLKCIIHESIFSLNFRLALFYSDTFTEEKRSADSNNNCKNFNWKIILLNQEECNLITNTYIKNDKQFT